MTVSYFVRYQGLGDKLPDFAAYYREKHARILAEFPGLQGLVLHTPADWADPFAVNPDPTEFLAQMQFASADALATALASDARERARADFPNLPAAERVTHQAMRSEKIV